MQRASHVFWFLINWVLFVQSGQLSAQTPAITPADHYAAESLVIERFDSLTVMNADGTGYRERTMTLKVQSEASLRQLGVISVSFASASERVTFVYARVRRPDGTVAETPVADALEQTEPVTQAAPFYSDLKQKQLPVKSLRVGDTLEWKVRLDRIKAEAPGQFWGQESFSDDAVTLAETCELRVPSSVPVTVWTNPKLGTKPLETTAAGEHVYRWEHRNLKPTTGKDADDEKERKKKILWTEDDELNARKGKLPDLAWTTFPNWAAVGAWYRGLEGDRIAPDAVVKARVAELIKGKTTEEDKVRAVYAYVGAQVRYIGVAFGIGRYQPHHADEVLENQYGDCKDKHTLLAAMLTVLGLHPDAVLIGSQIRFNQAVPSPAAFNHLITRVQVEGKEVWLDSTAEVAPYRLLTATIRDELALVVPDTGEAKIERTPADLPFPSYTHWKAMGKLDKDGISDSRLTLTFRGEEEVSLRQVLRQIAPAQYDDLVQRMSSGMGYSGTTSHAEVSRPDATETPLTMSYDYHREKGGDWEHLKTIPQLEPVALPMVDEKEPPVASIELGVPRTESSESVMTLPPGWGVELPEAVHEKTPFATYDLIYRFDKGTLYAERRIAILQERLPATEWKSYKKWQDAVGLGNETFVQLTRAAGDKATAGASNTPAPQSNQKAEDLIRKAFEQLQKDNIQAAAPLLTEAQTLNPQQKGLWAAFAVQSTLRGEISEAIADYRKEIALHPDEYAAYRAIAQMQLASGKRADAQNSLRSWIAADATDPVPLTQLIKLLTADNKASEAVKLADAAMKRLPEEKQDDEALQLALGQAEVKSGDERAGSRRLVTLLTKTENLQMKNTAAYLLADANLSLIAAAAAEQSVLDKLDAETQTWTLDEAPETLRQQTGLLIASWDTMGWILFRQGELEKAREYVQAAWLDAHHSLVGGHLGDIEMALGNPKAAFEAYELAASAVPRSDSMGVSTGESAQQKTLHDKADTARKAGGQMTSPGTVEQQRTVALGAANGKYGAAEYRLLLVHGKVERVVPSGSKTVAGGEDLIRRATFATLVPKASNAKLMRGAVLNCHANTCDLILEP